MTEYQIVIRNSNDIIAIEPNRRRARETKRVLKRLSDETFDIVQFKETRKIIR